MSEEITYKILNDLSDKSALEDNIVVMDGLKVLKKFCESKFSLKKIFATELAYKEHKKFLDEYGPQLTILEKSQIKNLVGQHYHQGIIAIGERPSFCSKPISSCNNALILNGLTSPENIGSMMRIASAFNIQNIVVDSKTCSPFIRRAIRVSMGNVFNLQIYKTEDLLTSINELKDNNITVYATANISKAISLHDVTFSSQSAIIIGSEGHGIDPEIIENSSQSVKIPISDHCLHLNASSAASIFCYEFSKHRGLI
jgi:tRNA G18 (ribose-2'-O)-methylase SpoU